MTQEQVTPALRFKQFDNSWKSYSLKDVTSKIQDGTHFSPQIEENGKCLYVTSKNIRMGYLDLRDVSYISEEAHDNIYKRCDVLLNDILLTKDGASTGNVCINTINEPFSLLSSVAFLRVDFNKTIPTFLFQVLASDIGQREIFKSMAGQAITRITLQKLRNYKFFFPPLKEQQKIADFLGAVDEKTAQLQKKKGLLEDYKKGCMQKLFSQEIRFIDDNGNPFPSWEDKELGELLDYQQPTNYLVSSTEYSDEYKTPVLTAGKTFILGYTDETEGIFSKNLPTIIFDDFTTAFHYVDFPFKAKSSAMKMLTIKHDKDNIKYIHAAMTQIDFALGEHKRYWISEYQNEVIPYPHPDEQKKIADFLSSLDDKISLVADELDKVKTFKKGLLQQMFV